MKKSEITQLTQIVEYMVAKEIRKQLPGVISEVFKNMMRNNQSIIESPKINTETTILEKKEQNHKIEEDTNDNLKTSLLELFSGEASKMIENPVVSTPKQYTKNPVFNQILNETVSDLRSRDMGMPSVFQDNINGFSKINSPVPSITENVSVLDVKQHVPPVVKNALTKNYSEMMKLVDKKKKSGNFGVGMMSVGMSNE